MEIRENENPYDPVSLFVFASDNTYGNAVYYEMYIILKCDLQKMRQKEQLHPIHPSIYNIQPVK